jgi:redox-sensitive bicupin YhaK (pirin superfamily)
MNRPGNWNVPGGPNIMDTQEELRRAFSEYRNGTFIKNPAV